MKSMILHKVFEPIELKIVNSITIIIISLFLITLMLNVFYVNQCPELQQTIYTFNTVFKSNFINILSRLFLFTVHFITLFQFFVIATFFCCLLYYQLNTSILHFCKELNFKYSKNVTNKNIIQLFH